jgi:hypothetical protein
VGQLPASDGQGPWLAVDGTGAAAVGAGLLAAEGLGLQLQEGVEGSFRQACRGGAGDLLQGLEVEVGAGAGLAEGAAGDNLAPLGGEGADFPEDFGW